MMRIFSISFLVMMFSCTNEDALRQAYIDGQVEDKIKQHETKKKAECLDELIERVLTDVDSVMLQTAQKEIFEDIEIPDKKRRPERPTDSLPEFKQPVRPDSSSL